MPCPWIHENEMNAARAEQKAGDLLGEEGRALQHRIDESLRAGPGLRS